MSNVQKVFMKPLALIFTGPDTDDRVGWLNVYENVLSQFDDDTLSKAAAKIIATRTMRSFPLPAECREACEPKRIRSFADQELDAHKAWIMCEADKIALRGKLLPREQ
jgi:hypothetical protein